MLIVKGKNGKSKWVSENILYKEYVHLAISEADLEINPYWHDEIIVHEDSSVNDIRCMLDDVGKDYSCIFLNLNIDRINISEYIDVAKNFNCNLDKDVNFIITVYSDNDTLDMWYEEIGNFNIERWKIND